MKKQLARVTAPLRADIPSRIDLALILRGLAAYQVLVWHTGGYAATGPMADVLMVSGRQCVWIFFVLSGYLISHGFFHARYPVTLDGARRFYLARFLRIVPLYLFITLLTVVALHLSGRGREADAGDVTTALLFLSVSNVYPSVFWTLVVEFWFYASFPVVAWWIARTDPTRRPQLVLLLYFGLTCVPVLMNRFLDTSLDNRTVLGNYSHFLAGVAMHFAVGPLRAFAERRSAPAAMLWLGCSAIALTALTTYVYHVTPTAFWIAGGLFTDAATCAVLGVHIILEARDRRADGVWAFLSILGLLAYGVYGWHAFLLTLFPQLQGNLGLVSLLTAILACLSYLCLERPMLQLRKRRMHIALPGQQ